MLHAYSMFDINELGFVQRVVSITYMMVVGKENARVSVIIAPEADQVNASICPGVSITMYGCSVFSSRILRT